MKNLTINLISITFLILVFLSSRIIFKDIEYSYIEVTMPIRCGITDNNNLDINSFHIDTIRLGDKSVSTPFSELAINWIFKCVEILRYILVG